MSQKGLKKVSKILSQMQTLRLELLGGDPQNILLGHMLEAGKEAMKDKFIYATVHADEMRKYLPKGAFQR